MRCSILADRSTPSPAPTRPGRESDGKDLGTIYHITIVTALLSFVEFGISQYHCWLCFFVQVVPFFFNLLNPRYRYKEILALPYSTLLYPRTMPDPETPPNPHAPWKLPVLGPLWLIQAVLALVFLVAVPYIATTVRYAPGVDVR